MAAPDVPVALNEVLPENRLRLVLDHQIQSTRNSIPIDAKSIQSLVWKSDLLWIITTIEEALAFQRLKQWSVGTFVNALMLAWEDQCNVSEPLKTALTNLDLDAAMRIVSVRLATPDAILALARNVLSPVCRVNVGENPVAFMLRAQRVASYVQHFITERAAITAGLASIIACGIEHNILGGRKIRQQLESGEKPWTWAEVIPLMRGVEWVQFESAPKPSYTKSPASRPAKPKAPGASKAVSTGDKHCNYCNKSGHLESSCWSKAKRLSDESGVPFCRICKSGGHLSVNCPAKSNDDNGGDGPGKGNANPKASPFQSSPARPGGKSGTANGSTKSYGNKKAKKVSFTARPSDVAQPFRLEESLTAYSATIQSFVADWTSPSQGKGFVGNQPILLVFLLSLGVMAPMFFDTGTTSGNLMPTHLADVFKLSVIPQERSIRGVGDILIQAHGIAYTDLMIGSQLMERVEFVVYDSPDSKYPLVGFDVCCTVQLALKPVDDADPKLEAGGTIFHLNEEGVYFPTRFDFAGSRFEDEDEANAGIEEFMNFSDTSPIPPIAVNAMQAQAEHIDSDDLPCFSAIDDGQGAGFVVPALQKSIDALITRVESVGATVGACFKVFVNDGVRDRDFTALQELKQILELVWAGIERSTQKAPPSASDTPNPIRFAVRLKENAPAKFGVKPRHHAKFIQELIDTHARNGLASGIMELVPPDEMDKVFLIEHCAPVKADGTPRLSLDARLANSHTVAIPI